MTFRPLVLAVLAALAAAAPAAQADAAVPRLVGSPQLTYSTLSDADNGQFISIGATVRLDRPFASTAEQHRYAIVAAPRLRRGQRLPDEAFGGTTLGRLGHRRGAWYAAEAVQLQQRRSVAPGARWQVALARGGTIVGLVKTARLRPA
jgi:hypothetical protein